MQAPPSDPIEPLMDSIRYVAASKSVEDLLLEFQQTGDRFAVVVDEYGAAEGIVTVEDIMERVVGELEDEYDKDEPASADWVKRVDDKHFLVNPRVDLIALNEDWGISIPDGPYETLGGFMMELAGDIPKKGQILKYRQTTFTIEAADEKRVREVRIQW